MKIIKLPNGDAIRSDQIKFVRARALPDPHVRVNGLCWYVETFEEAVRERDRIIAEWESADVTCMVIDSITDPSPEEIQRQRAALIGSGRVFHLEYKDDRGQPQWSRRYSTHEDDREDPGEELMSPEEIQRAKTALANGGPLVQFLRLPSKTIEESEDHVGRQREIRDLMDEIRVPVEITYTKGEESERPDHIPDFEALGALAYLAERFRQSTLLGADAMLPPRLLRLGIQFQEGQPFRLDLFCRNLYKTANSATKAMIDESETIMLEPAISEMLRGERVTP